MLLVPVGVEAGVNVEDEYPYYIRINKGTNVVTVYTPDDKPYTAFTCSVGDITPLGTFHTIEKYKWRALQGGTYGQYSTRITGHILFHSVWYYETDQTKLSYDEYNKLGTAASHGCCRLTAAASKWIYDNCPVGTEVIIFDGDSGDDPFGKPDTIQLNAADKIGWDPTDPDENNPYATAVTQPRISAASKKRKLECGTKFDAVELEAYDSGGNEIDKSWIRADGEVDMQKPGTYPVTYSVTDSFGRDASVTVKYVVRKPKKTTGDRRELQMMT